MRKLEIGTEKYTRVFAMDERGAGNANHVYEIVEAKDCAPGQTFELLGTVQFQNGPIKEKGVNGVMNEDLMAIVIDRLEGFQAGPYHCAENQLALEHLQLALAALNSRTAKREARGVEGTSVL